MCIIIICKNKHIPLKDLLKAEDRNPDGGGIAYRKDDKVWWKKGLTAKKINELVESEKLQFPYIIHFRIATVGTKDKNLCHPFPVSDRANLSLQGSTKDMVLFHNGTARDWDRYLYKALVDGKLSPVDMRDMSDTRAIAMLTGAYGKGVIAEVMKESTTSKFVFFSPEKEITYGHFSEDIDKNMYSNNCIITYHNGSPSGYYLDSEVPERENKWIYNKDSYNNAYWEKTYGDKKIEETSSGNLNTEEQDILAQERKGKVGAIDALKELKELKEETIKLIIDGIKAELKMDFDPCFSEGGRLLGITYQDDFYYPTEGFWISWDRDGCTRQGNDETQASLNEITITLGLYGFDLSEIRPQLDIITDLEEEPMEQDEYFNIDKEVESGDKQEEPIDDIEINILKSSNKEASGVPDYYPKNADVDLKEEIYDCYDC